MLLREGGIAARKSNGRMCGIAGFVWSDPRRVGELSDVTRALDAIIHRGPDGSGVLLEPGIAAGMRRLAIIDVAGGDQPIFNERGDVGVLFNGEIYNFRELRALCESHGHTFRTRSDTEVLVHLYEQFGADFVERLDGMFAFALWDRPRRTCLLGRDRFGVKPLHLARTSHGVAFASETKALVAGGFLEPELDPTALGAYFKFAWVPEQQSLWRGVERLLPSHILEIVDGTPRAPRAYHRHRIGGAAPKPAREVDAEIQHLLRAAVRRQLVADVPVGLFLSGGLDSSLIAVAASRRGSDLPCHTIDLRASDRSVDHIESDGPHARALADSLGLDLRVHELEPHTTELLPRLLRHMDEPSGDPAMITAFLIADAARPTTKVLLSGMGADEIAGGYRRHVAARALEPFYALPRGLRSGLSATLRSAARSTMIPGMSKNPTLRRMQKALERIPVDATALPEAFAAWTPPDLLAGLGLSQPPSVWPAVLDAITDAPTGPLDSCLAFDLATYLPSHNLHYVDKATMAASVEVRVPFLDNELAAYLLALPLDQKVSRLTTKRALRRAGEDLLPASIIKRSKTGFGAPIRSWLTGDLKPMVHDLLSPRSVRSRGLLDPSGVAHVLDLFDRDVRDLAYTVWLLLSLEIWCREVMDAPRASRRS